MKKVKIGMLGLGTVGSGVYKTLKRFDNVEIVKISVKNIDKPRNIEGLDESILTTDVYSIINDPEIDIFVEVIGGVNPAWEYISAAIKAGKHIVTANKELLAKKGKELFELAEENNRVVLYEAAIAGGIPLIMPLKTILAGNDITKKHAEDVVKLGISQCPEGRKVFPRQSIEENLRAGAFVRKDKKRIW